MTSTWTFEDRVDRNVIGGGYFRIVTLYRNDTRIAQRTYDGTLWAGRADRKALAKIREWREIYGAVPR